MTSFPIDGVYVDASYADGVAVIGVVKISNGDVSDCHRRYFIADSSHEAEAIGASVAMEIYPNAEIFMDNKGVAEAMKCVWLPRAMNQLAHRIASRYKFPKGRKAKLGGRGCIPLRVGAFTGPLVYKPTEKEIK